VARNRLIDADATSGSTEKFVKRDRLVGPEKLDRPLGWTIGQRRVPGTGAIISTLPRERILRLGVEHRSRGRKRQRRAA